MVITSFEMMRPKSTILTCLELILTLLDMMLFPLKSL